ncbi:GntR family transcriptional regulator [Salibacterium salarium]|uniref:GntR family transcriptional regulator n=1 Tax=Salibacterium salarium TaxID=284579 RepID=A0A3R9PZ22_9BACI|nr:GntR family transcriptional regulator [Salibacterium salarium]RSL30130.1 GntR family transcriptional regulator [Salibacterium salarium]
MFELDVRSRKPIYEQLIDNIKELIVTKVLKPDEKLPSVRNVSKDLTINPNTIQKAYRELEREGYLYSASRKGYFVAPIDWISNEGKLDEVKQKFQPLLREALYFGLTKEEWLQWFEEAKAEGGENNDSSGESDKKL